MTISTEQFEVLLNSKEDEHLEFKEAKENFHFEELVNYCVALANEHGGKIILGVTDKKPRHVVGSNAFGDLGRTKAGLMERLPIRIYAEEITYNNCRVVIFDIPSRPIGTPIQYKGAYWMRRNDALVAMTPDMLKRIFDESGNDFSAEICPNTTINDLSPDAIEEFRKRWQKKSRNQALSDWTHEQILDDAELRVNNGITYAALILMGTRQALGKYLAQSEIVFEYRSNNIAGPANQREEFREGFLLCYNRLWELINLRNDIQHYQDGLFMQDIPTFSEGSVREAILNAVSHRDYRNAGSIFIRQFPRKIEIVSSGGFPTGITAENILNRQFPRNRRIAETLAKCGFIERAGQGADRMFVESIKQSKPLPDFSDTDEYQVSLVLNGEIQDVNFLKFLEKVGQEKSISFGTNELLTLNAINGNKEITPTMLPILHSLVEHGIVEVVGRGRGTKYLLSRRFYTFLGKEGIYTRKRGLDRNEKKELLVKHIKSNGTDGCKLQELQDVLPSCSKYQIQRMLQELKNDNRIHPQGATNSGKWVYGAKI
ncbi:MAG: putative DNA binding domain-containing protein [Planctomycetaceae bacterium]|nr:putative DNA binding domain-containing protein [Planctomycetaceae bacterium]